MDDAEQKRYLHAVELRTAARTEGGQIYHRHVRKLIDDQIDVLISLSRNVEDHEIVAAVRQLQGMVKCLEAEGDIIHKGLQQGARIAEKVRVPQ